MHGDSIGIQSIAMNHASCYIDYRRHQLMWEDAALTTCMQCVCVSCMICGTQHGMHAASCNLANLLSEMFWSARLYVRPAIAAQ